MSKMFGRYGAVIIVTVIFLVLVVSVMWVNFNLSFKTEANAEVVNLAGRQRMLSQRIAKTLGNVHSRYVNSEPYSDQLKELKGAFELFNTTIVAFDKGGETTSTKTGLTRLEAVKIGEGREAVESAMRIWTPLHSSISGVIQALSSSETTNQNSQDNELEKAIDPEISNSLVQVQSSIDSNINTLLKLMNDLTNDSETLANKSASESRLTQTIAVIASLVCFVIIMYLILGQLRKSDALALAARRETNQIFSTVDQGLFIIDKDLNMGQQRSKALESIFSTDTLEGKNFKEFIGRLVSEADLEKIERFLKLLFDPRKKQRLLTDLNPLNELAIQIDNNGEHTRKYLNFTFSRVVVEREIVGILSSITDISRQVLLQNKLEEESQRNEQQIELISSLMNVNSDLLPEFIENSNQTYLKLNGLLKSQASTPSDFQNKADSMMALIHKVKGESAALGLSLISVSCHKFENQIQHLSGLPRLSGNDFLSLTVMLDQLIFTNEKIQSVFTAILSPKNKQKNTENFNKDENINKQLFSLCQEIQGRQAKKVELNLAGFNNNVIPSDMKLSIVSLASQLLRNAISHGVELPADRTSSGKRSTGQVTLALYDNGPSGLTLVCEDDGSGIDFKRLAQKAVTKNFITLNESKSISQQKILNLLLTKNLSGTLVADQDSGRGAGLSVVKDLTRKLDGKINFKTKASIGTRITIKLPPLNTQELRQVS